MRVRYHPHINGTCRQSECHRKKINIQMPQARYRHHLQVKERRTSLAIGGRLSGGDAEPPQEIRLNMTQDNLEQLTGNRETLESVLRFANACGAITTTGRGAIPSLPTLDKAVHLATIP